MLSSMTTQTGRATFEKRVHAGSKGVMSPSMESTRSEVVAPVLENFGGAASAVRDLHQLFPPREGTDTSVRRAGLHV